MGQGIFSDGQQHKRQRRNDVRARPEGCPIGRKLLGSHPQECVASTSHSSKALYCKAWRCRGKSFDEKLCEIDAQAQHNLQIMIAADREYRKWARKIEAEAPISIDDMWTFADDAAVEEGFCQSEMTQPLQPQVVGAHAKARRPRSAGEIAQIRRQKIHDLYNHGERDSQFNASMQNLREQLRADTSLHDDRWRIRSMQQRAASAEYMKHVREMKAKVRSRPLLIDDCPGNVSTKVETPLGTDSLATHESSAEVGPALVAEDCSANCANDF